MAQEIPHFNLNFDFLYTQENENDISNGYSQRVEKEKSFQDLTEHQISLIQLFVDVEAKATKSSNQWGCESLKVQTNLI